MAQIKVTLDSATGAKLGTAKLQVRILVPNTANSNLQFTDGKDYIELTAANAGATFTREATNYNSDANYVANITCDDNTVETVWSETSAGNFFINVVTGQNISNNIYDEYMYVNGKWELIGDTDTTVDLEGYATEAYVDAKFDSIPDPDLTNCVMKDSSIDDAGLEFTNAGGMSVEVVTVLQDVANKADADDVYTKDEADEKFVKAFDPDTVPIDFVVKFSSTITAGGNVDTAVLTISDAEVAALPESGYCGYISATAPITAKALVYRYEKNSYTNELELNLTSPDNPNVVEISRAQRILRVNIDDLDVTSSTAHCTWAMSTRDFGMVESSTITELHHLLNSISTVATSGSYNDLIDKPDLTNYYTKDEVDAAIADAAFDDTSIQSAITALTARIAALETAAPAHLTKEVVDELPTENINSNRIYIIPKN